MAIKVTLAMLAMVLLYGCAGGGTTANNGVSIASYVGEVTVDGKAAEAGQTVKSGNTVTTGADSYCDLVFGEKNLLRLAENTAIIYQGDDKVRSPKLVKGSLINIMRGLKTPSNTSPAYRVETATAVAAVRGTVFFAHVVDENTTAICCCNGKIDTGDNTGLNVSNNLASHHHYGIIYKKTPAGVEVTLLTNFVDSAEHNDSQMESAAAAINEKIDWSKID